jgi:cyclophilin family peptidyl-prolyl cis-trans isomerase
MQRSKRALLCLLPALSCGVPALGAPSPSVAARARLLRIEDTVRDEPAYLDSMLADPNPVTRGAAALTAGRIGATAHAPLLRALALEGDSGVAANALFSLGLLKDTASLPLTMATLRMTGPRARETAWLLGELGERGRLAIEGGLRDDALPPGTRAALLLAAARLRPVPAAAITPLLGSADSALAWRAAYAIARGRGTAGLRALLARYDSPWSAVREQVARGAARGLAGDSLGTMAQHALESLVRDTSAHVRMNAVRSLATYGPVARSAVLASLADSDINVRVSAAQSLEPVITSDSVAWFAAFDADTTFIVRRSLAEGAIRRGIDLAARARWPASAVWQRRAVAASLSGAGNASLAAMRASGWLRDPDGRVRAVGVDALVPLLDSANTRSAVRVQLRAALSDSDVAVRANSLGALRRGASVEDLASALASYRHYVADSDNDARLAFWRLADSAIVRAGTALPDTIRRELAALQRPLDPLERAAAAGIPRFAAWKDRSSAPQPLSWYEHRAEEAVARAPVLRIETERGTMDLVLYVSDAPLTVHNIMTLARRGYFDGQRFHRVVPNFVAQGGDPRGDGSGGPGYAIRDEINRRRYERGTLGMALSGPNTGGSQFFIVHSPQPHLEGGYTVFGEVLGGFEVLDRLIQGDRIVRVTVR